MDLIHIKDKGNINMNKDDRKQFEAQKNIDINRLGDNSKVFAQSKEMIMGLDEYNYTYLWSWMGLPIIQWPADIMATQEVLWRVKPDIVIETGVARGGSVVFMASMLKMMGKGKVIGIDIDIRPHNRKSIESHQMSSNILLIEGPSTALETLEKVQSQISDNDVVMVILDSDHSYDHVLEECRTYSRFVTKGSYLVVADTFVGHLSEDEAPIKRSKLWFKGNEPLAARDQFLLETNTFEVDDEINKKLVLSSSPGGYLRCND